MNSKSDSKRLKYNEFKQKLKIDDLDFQERSDKPLLGLFAINLEQKTDAIIKFQYIIINQYQKKVQKVLSFDNKVQQTSLNGFLKNSLQSICDYIRTQLRYVPIPIFMNNSTISIFLSHFKTDNLQSYKVLMKESIQLHLFLPNKYFNEQNKIENLPQVDSNISKEFIFYAKMILLMNQESVYLTEKHRKKGNNQSQIDNLVDKMNGQFKILSEKYSKKEQQVNNSQTSTSYVPKQQSNIPNKAASSYSPVNEIKKQKNEESKQFVYMNELNERFQTDEYQQMNSRLFEQNQQYHYKSNEQNQFQNPFLIFQDQQKKLLEDKQIKEKIEFLNTQYKQKQSFDEMINSFIKQFNDKQKQDELNFKQQQQNELKEFDNNMKESFSKISFWENKIFNNQ